MSVRQPVLSREKLNKRSGLLPQLTSVHFTSWCEKINSRARARPTASTAAAAVVRDGGAISGRERGQIANGGTSGERQQLSEPRCRAPPSRRAAPDFLSTEPFNSIG